MGFLDRLRHTLATPYLATAPRTVGIQSPFDVDNHLARVSFPTSARSSAYPITRAAAMAVPAVSRARLILANTVASIPLVAYRGTERPDEQPRWIDRTNGPVSPYHRMLWTVDDLLFYGWSCWACRRDTDGVVIEADRVPWEQWRINEDTGAVEYSTGGESWSPVDADSVIVIPGSHEGILTDADTTIRHARDLIANAAKATENPSAYIELHQTNDVPMTDREIDALVDRWVAARRGENGGVAFTSAGVEVREHGAPLEQLLIEGRNAAAVDVARACGIPATLLDATAPVASLNYQNSNTKNRELVDYGLSAYTLPISARLGMDDVVPRGWRVGFDMAGFTGADAPDDRDPAEPTGDRPTSAAPANPPATRSYADSRDVREDVTV